MPGKGKTPCYISQGARIHVIRRRLTLLLGPSDGLVVDAYPVGVVGNVLREEPVLVLPALVLPIRTIGARLDALDGNVLPVHDSLLRDPCQIIRRLDRLEEHDRLDLPPTIGGGTNPDIDRLTVDGRDTVGGVLPLHAIGDTQVGRVVEAGALEERSALLDLACLDGGDRLVRLVHLNDLENDDRKDPDRPDQTLNGQNGLPSGTAG